uniref:Reverse transcriptase domain-containing protein n=1 Tax=Astyanax mexicanus TaxID=7994 RepID=A0A3B1K6T8_ASTMX
MGWQSMVAATMVNHVCATKQATLKKKSAIPQESARAGLEDDSQADNMVTDSGTDMTTRSGLSIEAGGMVSGKELLTCVCGWSKVTSVRGLRIHQGKMRCLSEGVQGPHIEQYFEQNCLSQSAEVQRQVTCHSPQDINTFDTREANLSTEGVEDEGGVDRSKAKGKQMGREKGIGQRSKVKWPGTGDKMAWRSINDDLKGMLEGLKGTAESKLNRLGKVIYDYGMARFGVVQRNVKCQDVVKSRRQVEIEKLVKESRLLRKKWKKGNEAEREGIELLQEELRSKLVKLRRAEAMRKRRKKKERARIEFFRDPFRFVKSLFSKEKSGNLKVGKRELEEHFKSVYTEKERSSDLDLPADMPPLGDIEWKMDVNPPRWSEVQEVVKAAKAGSAPGPNGVPYRSYKSAPDVLKFLWKLMAIVWKKGIIPKEWHRAGGVLIPKEKDSVAIDQFRPISLLNVEGKIFFSVVARRLATYLKRNNLIDTSVQKAGIAGFSGCIEHNSMIWHQIQTARAEKKDLHVVFLDLANAFGSVPHALLWKAFNFFRVPEEISRLVKAYFEDIQFCFSVGECVTSWQRLEIGIMAGCTISLLAFTMAMEVIIRASKWVVGGERLHDGTRLPPVRAFMDDMTTLTTTVPCTRRLLGKLNDNLRLARMKVKPSKSRSVSIVKGKLIQERFMMEGEVIPSILEKPIKSLGRWYTAALNDKEQVEGLRTEMVEAINRIDKSFLPGKLKLWCLQFGLLPRLRWPLTVYDIPISEVERLERVMSKAIRTWLGVPRCLSSVAWCGRGMLELPLTSLVEEFKCAKVGREMQLLGSKDGLVKATAPVTRSGRKWNAREATQAARRALEHRDVVGQVQNGRAGLGLGDSWKAFGKATSPEKRHMVTGFIREQEEEARRAKAAGQSKQGQWMRWESVEKRRITWRELWGLDTGRIKFLLGATYDVLPTPQNLAQWVGEDPSCKLCAGSGTLKHILSACKVSLSQGHYTWRHNQVLRSLAGALDKKRLEVNNMPVVGCSRVITFVREGQHSGETAQCLKTAGKWANARDWKLLVDVGSKLQIPECILVTTLRPDVVLYSESKRIVYFIELTVPFEDEVDGAYERKRLKYTDLVAEVRERGWQAYIRPVEVGTRGFVAKSATRLLSEFGIRGRVLRTVLKELSDVAERSSQWLWFRRAEAVWGRE